MVNKTKDKISVGGINAAKQIAMTYAKTLC